MTIQNENAKLIRQRFATPVCAEQVRDAWRSCGFTFEVAEEIPGKIWHWETHVVCQVAAVVSGELVLEVRDEPAIVLRPGDEAFIPKMIWHRVSNASTEPCRWCFGYESNSVG